MNGAIEDRTKKLEEDLAALEAEGAKADQRRKVARRRRARDDAAAQARASAEIARLDEVWNTFKALKVQDLMGDEMLYREMKNWFGKYFEGHMGATAIQKRLEDFDIEAEVESLRDDDRQRQGPEEGPRPQAAQGRRRVPQDRQQARRAWCWTPSRSSRRTCARWCSSTVAGSRPPTSTTSTAG